MLISFAVENWMSYKNKIDFSMIASDDNQHDERLSILKSCDARILPIAAIYGGNASGKTNFIEALVFVKDFIENGNKPDKPIHITPFLLNKDYSNASVYFCIQLLVDTIIYQYSFSVDRKNVLEEQLVKLSENDEIVLFHRHNNAINFDETLNDNLLDLKGIFSRTLPNQLFLTSSVFQNSDIFKNIYDWFRSALVIIMPESKFLPIEKFFNSDDPLYSDMNNIVPQLDTGITELGSEEISFEHLQLSKLEKDKIQNDIQEGMTIRFRDHNHCPIVLTLKNGELIIKKLVTFHTTEDGTKIPFEITQESDGTQRVIDLLPAFLEISNPNSNQIYVIDELDRSLHTHLTKKLIDGYLSNCTSENRSQLLFTTHNPLLMNADLLRTDEMWLTERNDKGISTLYSMCDFQEAKNDNDLSKSYLQGRMGGIPNLPFVNPFSSENKKD